jgi:hypothetical protein
MDGSAGLEKKTNCPACGLAVWYLPASSAAQGKTLRCPKCKQLLLVTGLKVTGTSAN